MICRANLNDNLPVARHGQVAASTEMPLAIGQQADDIGSHVHVKHGCGDTDTNICVYFACAVISDGHGENVRAKAVRIDF